MKKITLLVLILITFCCLLALTSCDIIFGNHKHRFTEYVEFVERDCEHRAHEVWKCSLCDETNWVIKDDDPTTPSHDWKFYKTSIVSCNSDGYDEYHCTKCSSGQWRNWVKSYDCNFEQTSVTEPTCTRPGVATLTCTLCGRTQTQITAEVLPHEDYNCDDACDNCNMSLLTEPRVFVEISDVDGLKAIADDLTANYKLVANITLTEEWAPIGSAETPFEGVFDGNEFSILGLTLKTDGGLFAVNDGVIKNLTIQQGKMEYLNQNFVAGFLCGVNNGKIFNCGTKGNTQISVEFSHSDVTDWNNWNGTTVNYDFSLGLICGQNNGHINKCYSQANVTSTFVVKNNYEMVNPPLLQDGLGYESKCLVTMNYGAVTGVNNGTIQKCDTTKATINNNFDVTATIGKRGFSVAKLTSNQGNICGVNTGTVVDSVGRQLVDNIHTTDEGTGETLTGNKGSHAQVTINSCKTENNEQTPEN